MAFWTEKGKRGKLKRKRATERGREMNRLRDNVKEYLVKLLLKLKEVRPAQAAPLKKESVYLKVKITSEASSHHSG